MKYYATIILLLICTGLFGQDVRTRVKLSDLNLKTPALLFTIGGVGGAAYGAREMWLHHKDDARLVFKGFDYRFDPDYTWTFKYENRDPAQGAAYLGSTNLLVWTTDPYHAAGLISSSSIYQIGYNCKLDFSLFHLKRDIRAWKKKPKLERKTMIYQNFLNGTAGTLGRAIGTEGVLWGLPKLYK